MPRPTHSALLIASFCALLGQAPAAWAYLDPSTGSMILSAIVGIFATIGLALKTWWYKLRNLFRGRGASASAGHSPGHGGQQSAGDPTADAKAAAPGGGANRSTQA